MADLTSGGRPKRRPKTPPPPAPTKPRNGRPTAYSWEVAATICHRMAHGELLTTICAEKGMPSAGTVLMWLGEEKRDPRFVEAYARARDARVQLLADETKAIADGEAPKILLDPDGKPVIVYPDVNRDRLRVDTRKWLLGKLAPKMYSDKLVTEVTGADGGPLAVTVQAGPELAAVTAKLRAKLGV